MPSSKTHTSTLSAIMRSGGQTPSKPKKKAKVKKPSTPTVTIEPTAVNQAEERPLVNDTLAQKKPASSEQETQAALALEKHYRINSDLYYTDPGHRAFIDVEFDGYDGGGNNGKGTPPEASSLQGFSEPTDEQNDVYYHTSADFPGNPEFQTFIDEVLGGVLTNVYRGSPEVKSPQSLTVNALLNSDQTLFSSSKSSEQNEEESYLSLKK